MQVSLNHHPRVLAHRLSATQSSPHTNFYPNPQGHVPFAGVRLRPTDLARIGQMVLQKGQWQGHQIVPAEWIEASTSPQVKIGDGMQYGYQWWLGSSEALGHKVAWSAGFGNGGQRLYVVPELDLVVAITAGDYNDARIQNLGQRLFDCIAASVQQ